MAVPRFHPLIISNTRCETADAVSLAFAVPERLRAAYRYTPGQYLTLRAAIDGEDVRRSYSICSSIGSPPAVLIGRIGSGTCWHWP